MAEYTCVCVKINTRWTLVLALFTGLQLGRTQSWPVRVICWSFSFISLTRKQFSSLISLLSRTERPLLRAHITHSFLIYLLFINNLNLLALCCCSSLPRHAFIREFDLCWDTSLGASEENKRPFLCSVDGEGGTQLGAPCTGCVEPRPACGDQPC